MARFVNAAIRPKASRILPRMVESPVTNSVSSPKELGVPPLRRFAFLQLGYAIDGLNY